TASTEIVICRGSLAPQRAYSRGVQTGTRGARRVGWLCSLALKAVFIKIRHLLVSVITAQAGHPLAVIENCLFADDCKGIFPCLINGLYRVPISILVYDALFD